MKCPKCNRDLISTGLGYSVANNLTKEGYKCVNKECHNYERLVGRLIGSIFRHEEI